MKRAALFTITTLLFFLMTSCASSPNWSGAETNAGEFVWSPSPGIRFYVQVILLGGLFLFFLYGLKEPIKSWRKGEGVQGIGCFTVLLLFLALALWTNVRDYIFYESFSINQDRIRHGFYTNVWKTRRQTEILEWNNISYIGYSPEKYLESTTWIKVNPVTRERVGKGSTEEGVVGRLIHFSENDDKQIEFVLEKKSYNTEYPQFMRTVGSWIFGSEDYAVSPEEERRLKEVINKYLPEKLKESANDKTKEYLNEQE